MNAESSLLSLYDRAPKDVRVRGRQWYRQARAECRDIADDSPYTFRQVAAVMAVTSVDTQLAANVKATRAAIANHGRTAGRYPADQLPKIAAILAAERDPGRYVTGPKVSAFYRAIIGDVRALVVDRWAAYAAGHDKDRPPRSGPRREIETAYRTAAVLAGETVRDFQAIVWIACRESTIRSDGRAHGMLDIHHLRKGTT